MMASFRQKFANRPGDKVNTNKLNENIEYLDSVYDNTIINKSNLNGFHFEHANGSVKKLESTSNGHLKTTSKIKPYDNTKESYERISFITACLTYFGFYVLMILGYINSLFFIPKVASEKNREGYVPLYDVFDRFYFNYVYRRIRDCWNRPVSSVPGAEITLKDRKTNDYGWSFEFTGTETKCLNLGSYNYLGFATNTGPCSENSIETIKQYGLASCSSRREFGSNPLHTELEELTAKFLNVDDAIVFGMGFATNSLNLPTILSPGCLVVSDEKNHASIILGLRLSGATIKVFKHNNMKHLENILETAVLYGQPNDSKPWKKILIIVEGVFSMEGTIANLPTIIELKKKYKAYVYLDEAHSIGAMGPCGRGIVDYFNINPKDIDILMGTFTKSFASAGGYIGGSKNLINFLRKNSHAHCYASSMAPPVAQQILSSMKTIMGLDGTDMGIRKIDQLARNTRYFRKRLAQIGVITFGHEDSPVVPVLVYLFSKIGAVVRTLTEKNIATVGVGFPATPLMAGRIRFCLSASHTKEQLDYALEIIEEVSDSLGLKHSRKIRDKNFIEY